MDKKNTYLTYLFFVILIVLIILLVIYIKDDKTNVLYHNKNTTIIKKKDSEDRNKEKDVIDNKTKEELEKEDLEKLSVINELTDYNVYFVLNNIINEYYSYQTNKEYEKIISILDKNYVKSNNLSTENLPIIKRADSEMNFYIKKALVKTNNSINYYFIYGEEIYHNNYNNEIGIEKNIKYIIFMNGNNYSIYPILENDYSIDEIANNFDLNKISKELNDSSYITEESISDERIVRYYISYYANMLYIDTEEAYNMLDESTKLKYPTLEIFTNNIDEINSIFTLNLKGYKADGVNGKRNYIIENQSNQKITLIENNIMDIYINF